MKTTVEVDEKRLKRVMHLTGLTTKKSAIDAALRHLERAELRRRLMAETLSPSEWAGALDPAYSLKDLREREKPRKARSK